MNKPGLDRILLSMRYNGIGHRANLILKAIAPQLWQTLRDSAIKGHQPRRQDPHVSPIGIWRLWREKQIDRLMTQNRRHTWQKAFRRLLRK